MLYEQVWLTYTQGPQMIGFTMAHQFPILLLLGLFGEVGCVIWCLAALVVFVRREHHIGMLGKVQFALAAITLALQYAPVDQIVLTLR